MRIMILPALLLAVSSPAMAESVFFDGFEGESAGTSTPYSGFANFNVTRGSVDLIANGGFGLQCYAGNRCVDLNGSSSGTSNGQLTSKNSFTFAAGDSVRLSFFLSGNQRPDNDLGGDSYSAGFTFTGGPGNLASGGFNTGSGDFTVPNFTGSFGGISFDSFVFPDADYAQRSIYFTAASAGTLTFFIQGNDTDDFGPLLDSVNLDVTPGTSAPPVPEPATWATMLLGFGLAGAALRRRRAVHAL